MSIPILLSLCIPTYNRAELLREALTRILSEITEDMFAIIEIVISNNVSTDNTEDVCLEFYNLYPNIRWNITNQRKSLGADNVQIVTQYARGDYIWILSDDDLILPGSLKSIIKSLYLNYDIIIINHTSFTIDPSKQTPKYFKNDSDRLIEDKNQAFEFINTMITFLSIICFRSKLVDTSGYNFSFNTNLPQSYMFIDAILKSDKFYFIASPVLSTRLENSGGYKIFDVFVDNYLDLLKYAQKKGLSKKSVKLATSTHLLRFVIPIIMDLKIKDNDFIASDWQEANRTIKKFYHGSVLYWFVVLPLLKSPPLVSKVVLKLIRMLRGKK